MACSVVCSYLDSRHVLSEDLVSSSVSSPETSSSRRVLDSLGDTAQLKYIVFQSTCCVDAAAAAAVDDVVADVVTVRLLMRSRPMLYPRCRDKT